MDDIPWQQLLLLVLGVLTIVTFCAAVVNGEAVKSLLLGFLAAGFAIATITVVAMALFP